MPGSNENNLDARDAWNTNAEFWDEQMGEGNDFFNVLVWPAVVRLLPVQVGSRILDVACGNGLTSRRLSDAGANVVAIDFSDRLIAVAKGRSRGRNVDYRVVDATDPTALVELGLGMFDAALCNMALMDMADIRPLMKALAGLLCAGGAFVFSVLHPCFNNPSVVQMGELEDREGTFETTYSVKVSRYPTSFTRFGAAMHEQPTPHPYFHRSLSALMGPGLDAGFVLDALEECAFPPGHPAGSSALSWGGQFCEIPPVLVVRMRSGAA